MFIANKYKKKPFTIDQIVSVIFLLKIPIH